MGWSYKLFSSTEINCSNGTVACKHGIKIVCVPLFPSVTDGNFRILTSAPSFSNDNLNWSKNPCPAVKKLAIE